MPEPSASELPEEVLIRAAYALLLAADTTHEDPAKAQVWHDEREKFVLAVQRQILRFRSGAGS